MAIINISLAQVFTKGSDFNNLGGETGGDFKICGDEIILDIPTSESQMKSKKKRF